MIEVLNGGTRATVQDAGRPGHRHLGIPQSGAADKLSLRSPIGWQEIVGTRLPLNVL